MIFYMLGREHHEVLTAICLGTTEAILDADLASVLSVELGSEVAQQLRDDYGRSERQELSRQLRVEKKRNALNELLTRSEAGEHDAWYSSGIKCLSLTGLKSIAGEERPAWNDWVVGSFSMTQHRNDCTWQRSAACSTERVRHWIFLAELDGRLGRLRSLQPYSTPSSGRRRFSSM